MMRRVMKSWVLLLILAMTAAFATAFDTLSDSTQTREQRLADDAAAKEEFHHLNFFAEGRGMHLAPGMWDLWTKYATQKNISIFQNRWGLNVNGKTIEGIFNVPYKNMDVAVLGCVACHSGKAAGQYIIGLGNKNIDVAEVGRDGLHAEELWRLVPHPEQKSDDFKEVQSSSIEFAKILSNSDYTNLTQGMVPTSVIRTWFYRQAGLPIPKDLPRAAVKVPFPGVIPRRKRWEASRTDSVMVVSRVGQSPLKSPRASLRRPFIVTFRKSRLPKIFLENSSLRNIHSRSMPRKRSVEKMFSKITALIATANINATRAIFRSSRLRNSFRGPWFRRIRTGSRSSMRSFMT